jgi:hypothetical protein
MNVAPPRTAVALLRACLSREDGEVIAGDLEETLRTVMARQLGARAARRWYWRQVVSILWAQIRQPPEEHTGPPPKRRLMAAIRQDLIFAIRSLRKQPALTLMAALMLALGIGANVAIFSLVNAVLLKPLPFADPDRLAIVHMLAPDRDTPGVFGRVIWSYPKYLAFREHQRVFESSAAFTAANWNLTGSGSPERIPGEQIESSYFHVLGIAARAGRLFSAEETRAPGSAPIAVLGHGFWMRRFGGDLTLFGKTIGLNGVPHTVVGVLPAGFRGLTSGFRSPPFLQRILARYGTTPIPWLRDGSRVYRSSRLTRRSECSAPRSTPGSLVQVEAAAVRGAPRRSR